MENGLEKIMIGYFRWIWSHIHADDIIISFLILYTGIASFSVFINPWITLVMVVLAALLIIFLLIHSSIVRYRNYKVREAERIVNKLAGKL